MQHVEINVGIKKEQKGTQNGEKNLQASLAAGKFLGAQAIKNAFSLDFESMFLDMFTEIETPRAKTEAPAPQQVNLNPIQSSSPTNVKPISDAVDRNVLPQRIDTESKAIENNNSAPATNSENASGSEETKSKVETKDASASAGQTENKTVSNEQVEAEKIQIRAKRMELSAALQKKLSAEELNDLKKKIDDLINDDEISVGVLVSEIMKIVSDLAGHQDLTNVTNEVPKEDGEAMKKFFKRFLKEIGKAVETALDKPNENQMEQKVEPQIEAKVESALQKLVQKIKPKPIENQSENKPVEIRQEISAENLNQRSENIERREETPKVVELRKNRARETAENQEAVKLEQRDVRTDQSEILASTAVKAKAKVQAPTAPVSGLAEGISEVSRSGRSSEETQNFWQNSYNQNSSQKGINQTFQTQKQTTTQKPQQNPVFEQIVQNMKIFVTEGKSEATIRLKPEFLGKVEMKVTVEDGKVNVKFTAENSAVRSAITENIQELKKNLAELGLEVENVNVMLAGEFTDANTENNDSEEKSGRESRRVYGGGDLDEEEEIESEEPRAVVDGSTVRYIA